jgi:hypothetical protein
MKFTDRWPTVIEKVAMNATSECSKSSGADISEFGRQIQPLLGYVHENPKGALAARNRSNW